MAELELPLFPLDTVLFPGGILRLRIFETRYMDMVSACVGSETPFGVVLVKKGALSGAVETHQIGTQARIEDWYQDRDGLLGISVMGGKRFRIFSTHRQSSGLYVGRAMLLQRETPSPVDPRFEPLVRMLRAMMRELDPADAPASVDYSNATSVGMRLAELLPIDLESKQLCLEFTDPVERFEYLTPLIDSLRARKAKK